MATRGSSSQPKLISLETVRWRLALVWFPLCGLLFLVLVGQSMGEAYGDDLQRAWGWALPNFLPTLALMVSVFAADALRPYSDNSIRVRRTFYIIAMALSIFYLLILGLTILVQPAIQFINPTAAGGSAARIAMLEKSNIWLAPLQGLVIASLGVLFFLKEDSKVPPDPVIPLDVKV